VKTKYPQGMTFTQWRDTPYRIKHRLVGLALNDLFRYRQTCSDRRCRRARLCQDYTCYWRRWHALKTSDEVLAMRGRAQPLAKLLEIGPSGNTQHLPLY
jgi:hypothetical protein